ncbi:MAG: acetyl-CoA hydrolase/transferase family protein [Clostridia bacterium]|nr:acetyl-CoA hydrolase/transferase family protein [Clostridiales bacterium]MBR2970408.1 acetyl-CoA hydrolase/transferase family protein [Clostridia bacterium]
MAKTITIDEALALVKDNDKIAVGDATVEPQAFMGNLHKILETNRGLSIWTCLTLRSYPFLEDKKYGNNIKINSLFFSGPMRKAYELLDTVSFAPTHLRKTAITICAGGDPDIFVGTCTPPNKDGKVSLGLSNIYDREVMKRAKTVIMEVNPNMPFTYGDAVVDETDIDYFVPVDFPMLQDKPAPINEKDRTIGGYISQFIKDGDNLQIGIGAIPNSVVQFLETKKDLGIHTELLGDGIAELAMKGVVNGSKKTLHPGKIVTSIVMGTDKVYNYVNNNPDVLVMDCSYCNAYETLAKNDNQVSINTTLEVDLTGQCCSESIGQKQYSGTGGQADTAIGAQMAKGGRAFIALYSTANVRTGNGDERKEISRIVPQLKPGATVSLMRNDLHYLVTEYGVVNLRGLSVADRAKAIISIAHPSFRDELTQKAKELGLIKG